MTSFIRFFGKLWSFFLSQWPPMMLAGAGLDLRQFEHRLFPEQKFKTLYPGLRNVPQRASGKWIIFAENKLAPYKLIDTLPFVGKASVRHTAKRVLTTISITSKESLTLIEYLYPCRKRLRLSGSEDVLFARLTIGTDKQTRNIADFYIDIAAFNNGGFRKAEY